MPRERVVNREYATDRLRIDDAHLGLYDVHMRRIWIARKGAELAPQRISHARLLLNCAVEASVAEKDRFLCFWFRPPHTGSGPVQGHTLDWSEGHLMVRVDPYWDHFNQRFLSSTETAYLRYNIDQQHRWARRIFHAYVTQRPPFPLNWHMIGPRPADSMFDIQREVGEADDFRQ